MSEAEVPFVVFETLGKIDMRAFTLMGVSAKPNTKNPIGYFGTGLKYAMATLVRLGAEPVVYVGTDRWTFKKRHDSFRDVEFEQLVAWREGLGTRLVRRRFSEFPLPFAVSYGRNWKPWMAFRELESNTRDEQGLTTTSLQEPGPSYSGGTRIVVRHPEFYEAWQKRDEIFLPGADVSGSGVQVLFEESKYLYWRGLRVFELPKSSVLTYNFLQHIDLTEDRTFAGDYMPKYYLGQWMLHCSDEFLVEKALTAGEKHWEHGVTFPDHEAPSRAFHNVALRHPKNLPPAFHSYYGRHDERITAKTFDLYEAHPLPWRVEGNGVVDKGGRTIFEAPYGYAGKWPLTAAEILRKLGMVLPAVAAATEDDSPIEPMSGGDEYVQPRHEDELIPF